MNTPAPKQWLKGHTIESPLQLLELGETYVPESILYAFESALIRKYHRDGRGLLSTPEYNLLAICALDREVNHGGFLTFFINSSRLFAEQVVEAFEAIRAYEHAMIIKDAIAALRLPCPPSLQVLDFVMQIDNDLRDERLNDFDFRYYKLEKNVSELTLNYLSDNLHQIEFTIMGKTKEDKWKIRAEQAASRNGA